MDRFLLNGCYDLDTLSLLKSLGVKKFGFDLRARSFNLIPLHQLKILLDVVPGIESQLIFQDESEKTVQSILDLLRHHSFVLQFRDAKPAHYYDQFETRFSWFFHPAAVWEEVLMCRNLESVVLPLSLQDFYLENQRFWDLVDRRQVNVILHADTFAQAQMIEDKNVLLSIDLTDEVEVTYRQVDQRRLRSHLLEKL